MADNVDITAGSGTTVATDQVGSDHYQKIKIADGTADSSAMVPATTADGLLVNLGTNNDVSAASATFIATVRQDTATSLKVDASGVAVPVTDNSGSLTVDAASATFVAAVTPTSGVVFGISAASANTLVTARSDTHASFKARIEGNEAADAPSTTLPVQVAGWASSATPTDVSADGDVQKFWISRAGAVNAIIRSASGGEIATSTSPLRVDPTGTTAQPVTDNSGSLTVDAASATFVAAVTPSGGAAMAVTAASATFTAGVTPTSGAIFGISAASSNTIVTVRQDTATSLKVDASGVAVPVTDNSGSLTIDAASSTAVVTVNTAGYTVKSITALSSTFSVVGAAAKFGGYQFMNLTAAPVYIQCFAASATTDITLGTTAPSMVIPLPCNALSANGFGAVHEFQKGITFAKGIMVAATTTATGATLVGTAVPGFVLYE